MHTAAHVLALADEARRGALAPRVAATYDLEHVHEAHAALAERGHVGKVVVLHQGSEGAPSDGAGV